MTAAPAKNPIRLLLIDDSEIVRAGLRALLGTAADAGGSSLRSLMILTILVASGLGVYLAVLRLFGVVRITEVFRRAE